MSCHKRHARDGLIRQVVWGRTSDFSPLPQRVFHGWEVSLWERAGASVIDVPPITELPSRNETTTESRMHPGDAHQPGDLTLHGDAITFNMTLSDRQIASDFALRFPFAD